MQCRMQMGSRDVSHRYSGPRQCLHHLLKTEGPLGLTRGMGATIAREAPGNAIFFTVYEVQPIESDSSHDALKYILSKCFADFLLS